MATISDELTERHYLTQHGRNLQRLTETGGESPLINQMHIKPIGANQTELTISPRMQVLFSYETPVAAWIDGQYYKTDIKWSKTTSKHINAWVDTTWVNIKPQEFFNELTKL